MQMDEMPGINEVSKATNLPKSWWYASCADNRVPHYKCGKYLRFRWPELLAWLEAQRRGPVTK